MRTLSYTTLFLLFITIFTSCKTDSSGGYRTFYTTANKEYAAAISIGQARVAEEAELLRKENERIERKERKEAKKKQKDESVQQNSVVSAVSTDPLPVVTDKVGAGSVQTVRGGLSQQSAQFEESSVSPVSSVPMTEIRTGESKSETKSETKSKEPVVLDKTKADGDKVVFRKAKITAEEGYEGQLKKYSVVIASLSKKEGVERLKLAFEEADEPVVIAKNNKGIYYFILGSYDEKNDAVEKRTEVREKYVNRYSRAELLKQYAIPFSDVWIAVNE
ncbi:hypothetical protein [Dysgonomonas sp. ZJ279]|uniref:hypothetical protein n=1 Tax=Dysgonomonas sp. ZJ279 TaxID=2709796 RepID=UPI0013EC2589|nr:hypothetical protein [Dysgonomonas sp. ZJ279]